jgi:hypothetical protein
MPIDPRDAAPPSVTVYDETNDGWVARDAVPQPNGSIEFPAVIVFLRSGDRDGGIADSESTGARTMTGTVQIAVQLLMREAQTEDGVSAGMYLMRAILNSLVHLNEADEDTDRTYLGLRIMPASQFAHGKLDAPKGDNIVSLGTWLAVYDTVETTDLLPPE